MEIGVSGVNGALVARHASKESSQGNENATRQLLNTVARNAKEAQVNIKLATKMFLVQVFQVVFFFSMSVTYYAQRWDSGEQIVLFMTTLAVNGIHHVTSYVRRCFIFFIAIL